MTEEKEGGAVFHVDVFRCVSMCCCAFWFVSTCVFAGAFGWSYSGWVSSSHIRPKMRCRLTYSDNALISEKEMQNWATNESWNLQHPVFDSDKMTCICLNPEERPTWIAPGDFVDLYKEKLPDTFVSKYSGEYSPEDHIKACIDEEKLMRLWDSGHCHAKNKVGEVTSVFQGWDGSLYCTTVYTATGLIEGCHNKSVLVYTDLVSTTYKISGNEIEECAVEVGFGCWSKYYCNCFRKVNNNLKEPYSWELQLAIVKKDGDDAYKYKCG